MGRAFGTPAVDSSSDEEDAQQDGINDDQPAGSGGRQKRNCFIKCLRRQFPVNLFGCIASMFYTVIVFYSAISFHQGNYSDAAMKPLGITKDFTN